jgi:hypothetical protein
MKGEPGLAVLRGDGGDKTLLVVAIDGWTV